jgi:hypothetical protein
LRPNSRAQSLRSPTAGTTYAGVNAFATGWGLMWIFVGPGSVRVSVLSFA